MIPELSKFLVTDRKSYIRDSIIIRDLAQVQLFVT